MMSSNIKILALLVLCIFAAVANGRSSLRSLKLKNRIVGGFSSVEKQFPYQVSLRHKQRDQHFCGASIIKPTWIVTAAHCFFRLGNSTDMFYALVNRTHATDTGIRIDFDKLIMHPMFGVRAPLPDIALIRTKKLIIFSEFVRPINLPTEEFLKTETPAIVSGWGMSEVRIRIINIWNFCLQTSNFWSFLYDFSFFFLPLS